MKPYQVFIGCPFAKEMRGTYDSLKREIESTTPISLVLADTVGISSSNYLLESITNLIRESTSCIFDATGGNPNVSLEVGIAHTMPVDFILTMKTRKIRSGVESKLSDKSKQKEVKSIISDLQGKNRIEYKEYGSLKKQLEQRYFAHLPYMKRWLAFAKRNKGMVPLALELFEDIRTSGRSQISRLTAITEGSGFSAKQVLTALKSEKLVIAKEGRGGGIFYSPR